MIRPGVVWLSGSVIVTGSPTLTLACWAASSSTLTWRAVELIPSTGPGMTVAPTVGVTLVTRTGPGSNTTDPSSSSPVTVSPCADCKGAYRRGGRGGEGVAREPLPVAESVEVRVQLGHV